MKTLMRDVLNLMGDVIENVPSKQTVLDQRDITVGSGGREGEGG
jgi:hypothetical protein